MLASSLSIANQGTSSTYFRYKAKTTITSVEED